MLEVRTDFIAAFEKKISSAEDLLLKPEELQKKLTDIKAVLESEWSNIFSTLNESPLSNSEKIALKSLINRLHLLEKKVHNKLDFFKDFQKYIQVSLEK